jgi:arylsulfatase A-like enzyme
MPKAPLLLVGSLLCVLFAGPVANASSDDLNRPNVILIFADDLGYGDVACFHPDSPFQTPHLDRMAQEGARLTHFYAPTPYCAPSRGTLLTGRYPFRHTVVHNPTPDVGYSNFGLPEEELTLAELLRDSGYATAAYGKWHLGHREPWLPRNHGFDEYFGILYSNDMFPVQLVENERVVEYPVVQATLTRRYTERSLAFIDRNRERPFFLYLPHAMPHKPLAVSDEFFSPETPDALYADVIRELDWSVGQILRKLEQLDLDRRTLVIFTSDNGPWYGGFTGGLRGMKGRTWEGGLRVPLIARMPGTIPSGVVNEAPAALIDIFPTVCELAGISAPRDRTIDGRSLWPLWRDGRAPSPHEAIFSMRGAHLAAVRCGRWKLHVRDPGPACYFDASDEELVEWVDPRGPDGVAILAPYHQPKPDRHPGLVQGVDPRPMLLFDLLQDPGEQRDVSEAHPEVVQRLLAVFREMEQQVPDLTAPPANHLFRPEHRGQFMRLIGGDLRYDRVPPAQQHLLEQPPRSPR